MLLVIDIGNSNITLGVFDGEKLIDVLRMISDKNISKKDYGFLIKKITSDHVFTSCAIASVVDEITDTIKDACEDAFKIKPYIITTESNLPLNIKVDNPAKTGIDRIITASAAVVNYKKLPVVIADFGTATTFDIVSSDNEFIGGIIMPGIKMQAKALKEHTSKLPEIEIKEALNVIGKNTAECISSGILRGTAAAFDGLIKQIETELHSDVTVIATGGFCEVVSKYTVRKFDYIDKTLTLEGLRIIYEFNNKL